MTAPLLRTRTRMSAVPASASLRIPRVAADARAHSLFDGAWALQLPLCYVAVASVNAYLLRTGSGWILIDCGSCLPPGWDALKHALAHAGVAPEEIELVIATHSHCDHRGLAAEAVERTGATFAMGPGPHPQLDQLRDPWLPLAARRERGLREGIPMIALDAIIDDLPGDDGIFPLVEPDRVLEPGEQLPTTSGAWEVIATPGHSADQIGLWNARRRCLIGADLALPGVASYLEYGTRPDPHADHVASLEQAIALEPELLLAGHGRPIRPALACLLDCRQKVIDRVDAVHAALDANAISGWDVAEQMTPPDPGAEHYQRSLAETLCALEHLESRGQARAVIDDHGTRRWLAAG